MESPFVSEAQGTELASGRSYDVVLVPEDDNGAASSSGPDSLSLAIRCQFYDVVPGLGEPLLLHYENERFPLKRPVSAGELSGVSEWLVAAAGAPAAAAADAIRIAAEFYSRFPEARNSMAVIRVTRVLNNINLAAAGHVMLNYAAGGEADLREALQRSERDSGWERAVPASKAAVEALEKVKIRVSETKTETDTDTGTKKSSCVVCLEEFASGDEATRMPCEHDFHGECILKWLEYRPFCPICRFKLPSSSED